MIWVKGLICWALSATILLTSVSASAVPETSAACAILMDADSGRVLYEKNADEPRLIASITKLMTALTALESGHLPEEVVTIRQEWTGIEGSSLYLKPGEELRLETLLYGLLLRSGNDAAHAIAGFCGGNLDAFVEQMNAKARSLGMEHTHFENPSGLNGDEHYSTARDMAILARACLENETLAAIVATKSVTLEGRILTNHNKLLWQYEGCIGLKTGYTEKAGRTLVSAAQRDGMTLICVTLNAPNDWKDHASLFDYGFSNYERRCLVREGELLCTLPVKGSLSLLCPVRANEELWTVVKTGEQVETTCTLVYPVLSAPVAAGTALGDVVFSAGGTELGRVALTAPYAIPCDTAPARGGLLGLFGR